jgi:PAS domain S-box-containing protein
MDSPDDASVSPGAPRFTTQTTAGASSPARASGEGVWPIDQDHILAEVSKVLASTLDYRETLANIARLIVPQLADWFAVDLVDARGHFELVELDHKDPEQVQWARAWREKHPIDPDAPTGAPVVVRTGQSELYPEITDEMLVVSAINEEELTIARQLGLTSLMLVPLVARGKAIGVVTFVSTESGRKFDERDLALAEEVGRRAGIALDNARLYQQVQQLAAIVVSSSDAIIGKTVDGIITSWNAAAERMYGYSAEEIVGKPITLLYPPDRQDELTAIMEKIKKGEGIEHYETTRVRKDGTIITVSVAVSPVRDAEGEITGASTIARDISEQKRLEAELRRSKQQLEVIFANIADGISVQDANGRLIFMNEAGARRSGYASAAQALHISKSQTLRANTEQRFEMRDEHGNPLPYEELPGKRALRGEEAPQAVIQYFDRVLQTRQWALVKAQPIFDDRGRVELAVTIFSDVTESYEEKQRKDEFISMASHELKTPVTSLKGFTQILQRRLLKQGDDQALHYVARMDAQINRLTKLVSDLLDVSKMQAGKLPFNLEPFDLNALVQETVENVQAAASTHQVLVEGRIDGCIPGDKDRLGQVFINLLTNAVKYSPRAEKVLVWLSQDKEHAIVSVQDFGIGIDTSHHQRIFERFYQVTDAEERTHPGLGMGLYISNEIVQRHHGRMWVESTKGKGSTFCVALPLVQHP